jgi:hypothetical protein
MGRHARSIESLLLAPMLLGNGRFFNEHYRDAVPYWIQTAARDALQSGFVGQQLHRRFALGANQYVQNIFWNDQGFLP